MKTAPERSSFPLLACFIACLIGSAFVRSDRPNFVFVIADDLGWADISFHGGNVPTPNLDRLAKSSLELEQHYVAPVCSPTRTGLLTGRYWSRFGVTTPTNERALPWNTETLAKALGSVGYETALIGKWHLGSKPEWGPNRYGFDHSYGSLAGGVTSWTHRYKVGEYSMTWHRNGNLRDEPGHVTDLLTEEAVEWISNRDETPFFLYLPYTAVHLPVNEPLAWQSRVPSHIVEDADRHYAACIMHLDDAVGRILKALEDKGFRENTLFVFTSDNGGSTATNNTQPYPPDDSPAGPLPASNAPLRDQKGSVYEGGTRVPTLVSWPAKGLRGRRNAPVCVIDWMPTFCSLAGYRANRNLKWDGIDLSDHLIEDASLPDRPLYIAGPRWRASSLRWKNWKLVSSGQGDERKFELFDISKDISEAKDMSLQEPSILEAMIGRLDEVAKADNDAVVGK